MEGSFSPGASYEEWKAKRQFIAELIDSDGSILDIGCANGFFLRSLQEWSGRQLVPYGIDIQGGLIKQTASLFPQYRHNFQVLSVTNIQNIGQRGLPDKYDFIFWNFLGAWKIENEPWKTTLEEILLMVKRRLILGFYGTNRHPANSKEWIEERNRLARLPASFEKVGFVLSGSRLNPTQYNQMAAWIDKAPSA